MLNATLQCLNKQKFKKAMQFISLELRDNFLIQIGEN